MTVSAFTFVEMYRRALDTAAHLLDKGVAFAGEQGVSDADDMNPLAFQLMVVINFASRWPARVLGTDLPPEIESDRDVAGFRAAIAEARAYLDTLSPEDFAGRDDEPLTFKIADVMEPTMPGGRWLDGFATTNILFHLSIAYAILRMKGVPLGKIDLFAGGL